TIPRGWTDTDVSPIIIRVCGAGDNAPTVVNSGRRTRGGSADDWGGPGSRAPDRIRGRRQGGSEREPSFRARAGGPGRRAGSVGPVPGVLRRGRPLPGRPARARASVVPAPLGGGGGPRAQADHPVCHLPRRRRGLLLHPGHLAGRGPAAPPAVAGRRRT